MPGQDREFERALYALEQALYGRLGDRSSGIRFHDVGYIVGEVRRMWELQKSDENRRAVLDKISDPDRFIDYWKGVREGKMKKTYTKEQILEAIAHWEKRLARMDEDGGAVAIPASDDTQGVAALREKIDGMFGGDAYGHFVPDETDEMEGERRDLDEWDIWEVNRQSTIGEDYFWDLTLEGIFDAYDQGSAVDESEFRAFVDRTCSDIAETAWQEYVPDPDVDVLVYKGRDKGEAYWRS